MQGEHRILNQTIELSTTGECDIHDLTGEIQRRLDEAGIIDGQALVFVPGATGGLTTTEHEPGLLRDLPEFFERIVPKGAHYHHEDTWHDGNGHSHVRASLLGPSLVVPVVDGRMTLGTWQQIIFIDFDNRPRQRSVVLQLSGVGASG